LGDFAAAHADVIRATHSGFTFLLANGVGWFIAGIFALRWPVNKVATLLLLPTVMAALLGGHFLPYRWLYQTNVYLVLGILVSIVRRSLCWFSGSVGLTSARCSLDYP
jgi:hypothetical protein